MNSYQQVFSDRHTILTVIHVDSLEQANRNVWTDRESGANGVFLIIHGMVIDVQKNSSHQFTRDQIRRMIEHLRTVYKWQFTFLAANQDAFAEAAFLRYRSRMSCKLDGR